MKRGRLAHPDDALRSLARGKSAPMGGPVRRAPDSPQPNPVWAVGVVFAGMVVAVLAVLPFFAHVDRITVRGIEDGAFITKEQLQKNLVEIQIEPATNMRSANLRIDDTPLRVQDEGTSVRWLAPKLQDGEHRLSVRSGKRFLWKSPATKTIRFTVDSVAPQITIEPSADPVGLADPYVLRGTAEPGATVIIDGEEVPLKNGEFSKEYPYPPVGSVDVSAFDRAGNRSDVGSARTVRFPVFRGVHVTADAWNTPGQKLSLFRMADARRINTVALDLKDENGIVLFDSVLAQVASLRSGAGLYDLRDAVAELHSHGLRVMARIVVFRDPVLVKDAMGAGRPGDAVLGTDGRPFLSQEGLFANPLSSRVHDYNIALAREAADAGVDDILFDYVSRPLGSVDEMRFVGADGDVNTAIDDAMVTFLRKAGRSLIGTPTRIGVMVSGSAARSPRSVGQNVPKMATAVDYLAPIVFPSKFRSGSYGIGTPSLNPATIVSRALAQFKEQVTPTGALLLPWLQDYSVGPFVYGSKELRAQVDAASGLEIDSFMVWDPRVTYSAAGFPDDAEPIKVATRSRPVTPGGLAPEPTAATVPVTVSTSDSPES